MAEGCYTVVVTGDSTATISPFHMLTQAAFENWWPTVEDEDYDYPPEYYEDYEDDMIYVEGHGGGCCGASHLSNFTQVNDGTLAQLDKKLEYNINADKSKPYLHLYEVVLTDDQMMVWAKPLKERNFKFCARWLNQNSGNHCNLLIRAQEPDTNPPYEW